MGKLTYGTEPVTAYFDDRTLWHLKTVILDKLRRDESFSFTWMNTSRQESQRDCVWLNPAIALHFQFSESEIPPLNWKWIEALVRAANSPQGLQVIPEDGSDGGEPDLRVNTAGVL